MPADSLKTSAAEASFNRFAIESWTLLAIGICFISLRVCARFKAAGFKGLRADDYLVLVGMIFYAAETALAYSVGHVAQGLANNGLTTEERAKLSQDHPEYQLRVIGSKIQIAGWATYCILLWAFKGSLLILYRRLTEGLGWHYLIRIYIGVGFLVMSWIVLVTNLFLACRPFNKYWQIYPDPGNVCQPAVSNQLIWVFFTLNASTDFYLMSIPIPMLWQSRMRIWQKIWLTVLLSGGLLIVACAALKSVLVYTDPINGAQVVGSWAIRESFIALLTTNFPMVLPLLRRWIQPVWSHATKSRSHEKMESTRPNFQTIGGGGGFRRQWPGRAPATANPITGLTCNESEDVEMQNFAMGTAIGSDSPLPSVEGRSIHIVSIFGDDRSAQDDDIHRRRRSEDTSVSLQLPRMD